MLPMLVSPAQLVQLYGGPFVRAANYCPYINEAMHEFGIITPPRAAAFMAQIGHESGRLTRLSENLNYSADGLAETWPARFRGADGKPTALARELHRNPELIANCVYANRLGNGAPGTGDGWRYRGRGLIQITGRANYAAATEALGEDFLRYPALLETPKWAALSAGLFWATRGLNDLADAGDFDQITRRINGSQNGRAERVALYERARALIS